MARNIFELFGTITVNGLDNVKTKLSKLDDQFKQTDASLAKLGRQTTALGTAITKNVTLPIIALGAGLAVAVSKTIAYADNLVKLESVTGLTGATLQEFHHVANMTNADFGGLTNTIEQFTRRLPQLSKEGGPAYQAIKYLGVNIYDATGHIRNMNELFPEFIAKLQAIQNPAERVALAQQIFGRSVTELAPVLNLTTQQMEAMRKEAHDLGLVESDEAVKANKSFGQEVKKLQEQFAAFVRNIATDLIPILRDRVLPLIQGLAEKVKDAIKWWTNLDNGTKAMILSIAGFTAVIGPAILIAGKMVFAVRSIMTALALAKAAALGFNLVMAVNPFAVAIIGAAAFAVLLTSIINLENQRKGEEAKTKKNEEISAQLEEFVKLRKEQEDIIKTGEASHFQLYSKQSVADAKENLKSIQAAIVSFNRENGLSTPNAPVTAAQPPPDFGGGGKAEAEKPSDEYIRKLQEQGKTELQLLDVKEKEELAKTNNTEAEKLAIVQYFTNKRKRVIDEIQEKYLTEKDKEEAKEKEVEDEKARIAAEKQKQVDETVKQAFERQLKMSKSEIQLLNAQREDELSKVAGNKKAEAAINEYYDKMIVEKKKALMVQGLQFVGEAISKLGQLLAMNSANQIQQVENEQTAQEDAINKSTLSEKQKKVKLDALHADTAVKEKKLRHESAIQQKAISLVGAIINTALAVVGALAAMPGIPGIVMAAIVGALGIAEIAIIAAQPIPAAKGALIPRQAGGVSMQVGEGNDDEIVMPVKSGIKTITDGILAGIGRAWAPPQPGYAFAGAGGGSMARTNNLTLNIGTFIGDDRGIKELELRLAPYRILESQRKGESS